MHQRISCDCPLYEVTVQSLSLHCRTCAHITRGWRTAEQLRRYISSDPELATSERPSPKYCVPRLPTSGQRTSHIHCRSCCVSLSIHGIYIVQTLTFGLSVSLLRCTTLFWRWSTSAEQTLHLVRCITLRWPHYCFLPHCRAMNHGAPSLLQLPWRPHCMGWKWSERM
jgi:hypothetical protein